MSSRFSSDDYIQNGFSRFFLAGSLESVVADPESFVAECFGKRPTQIEVADITPVPGSGGYVRSNREARLHTDSHFEQAHVQFLICRKPAEDGGDSILLDSWKLLSKVEKDAPPLFSDLFSQLRVLGFKDELMPSFTFSPKKGGVHCTHPPFSRPGDLVGEQFQNEVDRFPKEQFRLSAGEVLVASNHRLLHGRTEFGDLSRHLVRILAWFGEPVDPCPADFLKRAEQAKAQLFDQIDREGTERLARSLRWPPFRTDLRELIAARFS